MYGKTKIAKITKVLYRDPCYKNMQMYHIDEAVRHDNTCYLSTKIYQEDIVIHSPNIIDLVQEGDYVNGRKVVDIYKDIFTKELKVRVEGLDMNWQGDKSDICYSNKDITSILTRERFNKEKYEV